MTGRRRNLPITMKISRKPGSLCFEKGASRLPRGVSLCQPIFLDRENKGKTELVQRMPPLKMKKWL